MFIYLDLNDLYGDCRKIYVTWMAWVLLDTIQQLPQSGRHFCKDVFLGSGSSMLALLDARLSSVSGTKVTGSTGKPKEKTSKFCRSKVEKTKSSHVDFLGRKLQTVDVREILHLG